MEKYNTKRNRCINQLNLLLPVFLLCQFIFGTTAQVFSAQEKLDILQYHNDARAAVNPAASNMQTMVWSTTLEGWAQSWVNGCQNNDSNTFIMDHSPANSRPGAGENIYASSGTATASGAVTSWNNEKQYYDYVNNYCSGQLYAANSPVWGNCGHYTQIAWAASNQLGCARGNCPGIQYPNTIVCNYSPAGNVYSYPSYEFQRPYATPGAGVSASTTPSPSRTPSTSPPAASSSPTRTPSVTPSRTPSTSPAASTSPTISVSPTRTPSVTPSRTPSTSPGASTSRTPSSSPSQSPSSSSSPSPGSPPSSSPSQGFTPSPTSSPGSVGVSQSPQASSSPANSGAKKKDNSKMIIAGAAGGGGLLLIAGAAAAFVLIRKKRNAYSPSYYNNASSGNSSASVSAAPSTEKNSDVPMKPIPVMSTTDIQRNKMSQPGETTTPNNNYKPPAPPSNNNPFPVGSRCKAQYTGDGQFYDAVVKQYDANARRYLVSYPDYGSEEWLPLSSLKK